jgi:hypothetical protein
MTATNHVVTGAFIAATITNPVICLPLALLSHLVLDSIPHFGVDPEDLKVFLPVLLTDIALASCVLLALILTQPAGYILIIAGAIVAASPDLLSIWFFVSVLKKRKHKYGAVQRFLQKIQLSETVRGLAVEVVWFGFISALLLQKIH